ncbi:hypothetical protein BDB01DRAFT_839147 [Pilobolus umbonatus]|nr:hypothetical protein BDB01DRAFT_839147 [Pilobolus umbonatus]
MYLVICRVVNNLLSFPRKPDVSHPLRGILDHPPEVDDPVETVIKVAQRLDLHRLHHKLPSRWLLLIPSIVTEPPFSLLLNISDYLEVISKINVRLLLTSMWLALDAVCFAVTALHFISCPLIMTLEVDFLHFFTRKSHVILRGLSGLGNIRTKENYQYYINKCLLFLTHRLSPLSYPPLLEFALNAYTLRINQAEPLKKSTVLCLLSDVFCQVASKPLITVNYLEREDYHNCLTVNKQYYSIFIKCLYENVCLFQDSQLKLFLDSLMLHSRCQEAGKYVRMFSTNGNYGFDNNALTSNAKADPLQYLMHLPNIEELTIEPAVEHIKALTDTKEPILLKLKILKLDPWYGDFIKLMVGCYYRYRASLTTIKINRPEFTAEEMVAYLTAFPFMRYLDIEINDTTVDNYLDYTDILKALPNLIDLNYRYKPMKSKRVDPVRIQKYFLQNLELKIKHMSLEEAQFIKDSFPALKILKLCVGSSLVRGGFDIVDTLLQVKSLEKMDIELLGNLNVETVANFVHQANNRHLEAKESVLNAAEIYFDCSEEDRFFGHWIYETTWISTEYDGHRRLITTRIYPLRGSSKSLEILDQIGGYLNKLEMGGDEDMMWEFSRINQQCPTLSKLELSGFNLVSYNSPIITNSHLTDLTIKLCKINVSTIKDIPTCYPALKRLYFLWNTIIGNDEDDNDNHAENEIHYIHMNVQSLIIRQYNPQNAWIIIKAVDGVWVKSWMYCSKNKRMVISEDREKIKDIKPSKDSSLYVFISNIIINVTLEG